ncbi:glycosyltransferase [Psychrobacter sp. Marseille-P5312]|uniref:glycosyltransferase n=1 Tax=Psychrobacter sp. Marseille-P5312 TaxID=2086574 RepID=UPI000CF6FD4C|nr:glycosyltransferase [Psychrobacter sp. Marseille-P5312]
MQKPNVCFILTDAISFQMLCRGQFEYFKENSDFDMTFVSGGDEHDFAKLIKRKVGNVFDAKLVRKPSVIRDFKSLITLISYFSTNRFDLVVYSTPKALLLGSIATSITRHNNTIAIIRGRAYENYSGTKRKIYQLLDKISLLSSKKVIFISDSLRESYLEEGLTSRSKSYLLGSGSSNGVDTTRFQPNKATKNDSFTVLVAGRICIDKGIQDLVEVIANIKSKNITFKLVGPVENPTSEAILSSLTSNYPNIVHVPYTDNIEQHFMEADLHLFLTHREGFGNVAIEAASCGIPTFAYDVIGVKDSVKEGISGKKFNFKDTASIAQAIDEASTDPSFDQRYRLAREWAIEHFSQEKVWNDLLKFYKDNL